MNVKLNQKLVRQQDYYIGYICQDSNINMMNMKDNYESQDQLNEEINQKLSELWKSMKNNKKNLLRTLTPHYIKKNNHNKYSQTNIQSISRRGMNLKQQSNGINNISDQNQVNENVSDTLKSSNFINSQQQYDIQQIKQMRNTISRLQKDKFYLLSQLESFNMNMQSKNQEFDESEIMKQNKVNGRSDHNLVCNVDGRTACFSNNKRKKQSKCKNKNKEKEKENNSKNSNNMYSQINKQNNHKSINKQNKQHTQSAHKKSHSSQDQTTISKHRLIELLKQTTQYREFAFYYDSHELSYLRRLQSQHRKNCSHNAAQHEKRFWAPTQLVNQMRELNQKQRMNLNSQQMELILGQMKRYYETNCNQKINKLTEKYEKKIQKLERQKENDLSYEMVRFSNARQRQSNKKQIKRIF